MMILSSDPKIQAFKVDCMGFMRDKPNKFWDLAIVDPPYGIGEDGHCRTRKKHNYTVVHKPKKWDTERPSKEYFNELKRVSKNQIIWGANYFTEFLPPSMGWVFWDKKIGGDFSDGELAYTSFDRALQMVSIWSGNNNENKIHPTQKPVKLYEWILTKYAKPGFKILDTHGGSMSLAIACYNLGFDLDICEMDSDYFKEATDRVKAHIAKPKGLFTYKETMRTEPNKLF